ncbi:Di-copper centre-containing protein, partial [Violaceomyces palustris]
ASDPLFWLHHVNVDRLWRSWQILWDPNYNRYEGNTIQFADQQDGGQEASLQDILNTAGMERNLTVSEVINPRGGYLCYEYDFYYSYGTESRPEDQIVRPPASSR